MMAALWPHLPALQIIVPLLAGVLAALLRRGAPAFWLTLAVSWIMPVISAAMLHQVLNGGPISYALGSWPPPWGIEYRVDPLNAFVLTLVSVIGAVIVPFARRSVAFEIAEQRQAWFYCMYLMCLAGLLGVTITGDAFNAFVFLEISSLSTYVLIALGRNRRALVAAFRYLIVGTIGATFYVIGVGFLYLLTGSLNMVDIAERLAAAPPEQARAMVAGLAFLTVGISLKLALFPLHSWLPGAYAYAPSWVTVFLSATATKVAIYLLVRFLFSIFGIALDFRGLPIVEILLALSIAAMFIASIIAVYQSNLKRMLAYSSLAQIGYMMLGIGIANQAGLTGGLVHLVNHAMMKAALFLAVGALFYRVGTVRIADIAGIGRRMPLTMSVFVVAGLGIVGTPGTAGFISKWYLAIGALDRGWWILVLLLVASSLISVLYIGRVIEMAWFRPPAAALAQAKDPPLSMLAPMLLLAAATVYFGIDTRLTAGIAAEAARFLLGGLLR
jgi:multicomponent Na+:H+ antiporter subunit D